MDEENHAEQAGEQPQQPHSHRHEHHYEAHADDESKAVHRLRERHKQLKHEHETDDRHEPAIQPQKRQRPITSKRHKPHKKGKQRIIFWSQILIVLFICITAGLTIRAFEMASIKSGGLSWFDELKQGNIELAIEKFSVTASSAVSQVFNADLSVEMLMKDFNDALPHLKRAGYILIEMEVELGIPPKLIPHFYRDNDINMDLQKTLAAIGDNNIGKALIIALNEASQLQKKIEVADMQFNYIEVELGPIPALKLQYKNYYAVKKSIQNSPR